MNVLKKKKFNTLKGFTLVELIVVLVLMMIFISLGVGGILTWQDWSRYKKENTAAETIFYSVQNQFTELDATDAFDSQVTKTVKSVKDINGKQQLLVADITDKKYFAGISGNRIEYDVDSFYVWEPDDTDGTPVWANTPLNLTDTNEKKKYQGSIYRLSANKNDYDKYLNKTLGDENGTKLLFDLITPYISDKSVLNGAIWVEFSPEARQVFSVCYSDRVKEFGYASDISGDITAMLDRTEDTRRDLFIGYYAAESLSIPTKGRDKKILGEMYFDLQNPETFNLVIKEEKFENIDKYVIDVCPALDDELPDEDSPLMTINLDLSSTENLSVKNNNQTLNQAFSNPAKAKVTFYEGYFTSDYFKNLDPDDLNVKSFYPNLDQSKSSFTTEIPVFVRDCASDPGKKEVVLVLDAADVQAQSYLCEDKNKPEPSLINTYSFYRFGFDLDKSKILKIGCVLESGSSENSVYTEKCANPVFANANLVSENNVSKVKYEIENGRHLYNVRFEIDYKNDNSPRIFAVTKDIDWAEFSGNGFFLNSYSVGKVSGINYDGMDNFINKSFPNNDITKYDFPGFRSLGINDEFTGVQVSDTNRKYTAISNLHISFSANMAYGVYGKDSREEWNTNNVSDFNKYENISSQTNQINWTTLNNYVTATHKEKHPSYEKVMRGLYPLGLFAENSGSVSNLELNRHRVIGMEKLGNDAEGNAIIVFTNMVGGFVGNNLGNMNNLCLRNVSDLGNADTRANENTNEETSTKVNGRTDVGGILGRESWTILSDDKITLFGLSNYGKITGMENIGGIVGRAYLIRDFVQNPSIASGNVTKDYQNYYFRRIFYNDGYDIYGRFDDNGKYIASSSVSMTGKMVKRVNELLIENCQNRGEVCGDDLVYENVISLYENTVECQKIENSNNDRGTEKRECDMSNYLHQCSNIGGIAGTTIDGVYYDCRQVGTGYTSNWSNNANQDNIKLTLKNCNAYRLYPNTGSAGEGLNVLVSKAGTTMTPGHIYDMIRHDFYVGGLIGYCRFTNIDSCGNDISGDDASWQGKSFVFGRNYVGGLFGCFDFSKIMVRSAKINNRYNIVNNNNVIGVMYVGGFSGGNGIGCCKQENISYRHPINNEGSQPSQVDKTIGKGYIDGILNVGAVLGIKRKTVNDASDLMGKQDANINKIYYGTGNQSWQENLTDEHDSGIGGIVGISRLGMSNVDNIQSNRAYVAELIGGIDNLSYANILNVHNNSYYGGNAVGGIAGIVLGDSNINKSGENSVIDAIVFGDDVVGGAVGGSGGNQNISATVNNCILRNTLIVGRNMVGGYAGVNNVKLYCKEKQTAHYDVYGHYAVGGVVGYTLNPEGNRSSIGSISNIKIEPTASVTVNGSAYVGGFVGMYSNASVSNCSITNVTVNADNFAGGIMGAIGRTGTIMLNSINVIDRGNVINSTVYSGGYAGLYNMNMNDWERKGLVNLDSRLISLADNLKNRSINDRYWIIKNAENANGALYNVYSSRDTQNLHQNSIPANSVVKAAFGAGGVFGYISGNTQTTFNMYNNTISNVRLEVSDRLGMDGEMYSHAGGIVGYIPKSVVISNASFAGSIYSKAYYLGQIAEVNAGTVNSCTINSMDWYDNNAYNTENIYTGGLVGLNANTGSITADSTFAGTTVRGRNILGGYMGVNRGTLLLVASDGNGYNVDASAETGHNVNMSVIDSANGAIGFLIGSNEVALDLKNAGKIASASITSARYAGSIAGVNTSKGTIYNSTMDALLKDDANRNSNIRYALAGTDANGQPNAIPYGTNVTLNVTGITNAGLVSGLNEGIIRDICICKYNNGQTEVCRFFGGTNQNVGSITGQNGREKTQGTLSRCYNFMDINAANAVNAAGIAGSTGGRSVMEYCDNYGNITGTNKAAGISAEANVSENDIKDETNGIYVLNYNDCVNSGTVTATTADTSACFSSGIAVTTGGLGQFALCRNYGTVSGAGLKCGITCDDASGLIGMTRCLEAGGLNENDGRIPLAPNCGSKARNFYVFGDHSGDVEADNLIPKSDIITSGAQDSSHWPTQLYIRNNGAKYDLVFKRWDYFFNAGISGLDEYPLIAGAWGDSERSLDIQFVNMVANESSYPDKDRLDGDTIVVGFVNNSEIDYTSLPEFIIDDDDDDDEPDDIDTDDFAKKNAVDFDEKRTVIWTDQKDPN
ncbi:MAG: hypothetical protein K6G75_13270 [Lachnospiraceae bacterium]|nr:hypothetical protein [Lachnospiraceae bacterium]